MEQYISKEGLYQQIDQVRREYNIPSPCDPYQLAKELGISIVRQDLYSPRLCGALIRTAHSAAILLSDAYLPGSERFTLAHELGHFFLHREIQEFFCDGGNSPLEWQANTVAAELLMPYRILLPTLAGLWEQGGGTTRSLHQLAEKFQVSTLILRHRTDALSWELWQLLHGVPIGSIRLLSKAQQMQLRLPQGPSAQQLFPTRTQCADICKEPEAARASADS